MTSTTNGASLEDCLTNIFSLIDLNGIRWKRFKHKANSNYLYTPIDTHPILTTYAKCLEEGHIAVWRHEPQKRHLHSGSGPGGGPGGHGGGGQGGGGGSANHSNYHTPTRTSNNNTPTSAGPGNLLTSGNLSNAHQNQLHPHSHQQQNPPGANANNPGSQGTQTNPNTNASNTSQNSNNLNNPMSNNGQSNNFELWLFGYGHQLKVDNVINDDLVEIEDDTYESKGLSYECRQLLFRALHNLVERCLTSKGFAKLGRWFVRPLPESRLTQLMRDGSAHDRGPLINEKPSKFPKIEPHSIINDKQNIHKITTKPSSSNTTNHFSSAISATLDRILENRILFDSQHCLNDSDSLRHARTRSSSIYFTSSLDGSKSSLPFSFDFFVHGDSTICATVDVRQHPLVSLITRSDLIAFQKGAIIRVALAPFGLNGVLNGVSYKDSDNGAATTAFIQQWDKFYPLPKTLARLVPANKSNNSAMIPVVNNSKTNKSSEPTTQPFDNSRTYLSNLTNMLLPPSQKPALVFDHEPYEVPPVVEVIVAGHRMRYPSECVFVTSRVVDPYKSITPSNSRFSLINKRTKLTTTTKTGKFSLLSDKPGESKQETHVKIKTEPEVAKAQLNSNSPFRLDGKSSTSKPDSVSDDNTRQANSVDNPTDKNFSDTTKEDGANNINSCSQATISRSISTKVGFTSMNTPLGPTDLVKLFPTPPSLEQIAPSPSTAIDETGQRDPTLYSPANQGVNDSSKESVIDVYKPVEYALMPPPPKWTALTTIIASSFKSLPPECIYKGSPQSVASTKKAITRFNDSARVANTKSSSSNPRTPNSILNKSLTSPSIPPSPLTDQTNKHGFINNTLVKTPVAPNIVPSPSINTNPDDSSDLNLVSSNSSPLTLPHQKLFNNLTEISSIQLNLMIADSPINLMKDHNFESCTLCVCNMSVKGSVNDMLPLPTRDSAARGTELGLNSPSNQTGEFVSECTCGFSALTNRHQSHLSGLFLEDEFELTNILYDPTEMIDRNKLYRKLRLSTYSDTIYRDEQKLTSKLAEEAGVSNSGGTSILGKASIDMKSKEKSSHSGQTLEETRTFVIDQLKQQCTSMIHTNSSLSKVLFIESSRNNRHLTSCTNYNTQSQGGATTSPVLKLVDENYNYTTVKMVNRNPTSLKFTDTCEFAKGLINRLANQSQPGSNRLASPMSKHLSASCPSGVGSSPGLANILTRIFSPSRTGSTSILAKPSDSFSTRNSIFLQGLQALVLPTISIDPRGALRTLEQLMKEESKEALATLNKAILIFASPIHDWQFLNAPIPENNFEVANLLKVLQPIFDSSIGHHNKLYKDYVHQQLQHSFSARDSPSLAPSLPTPPCQGPLTWRQFHQCSGRGTEDQCEPQPIPSLLVGHHVEKNHLALSPFALKFWDKLMLEPYAPGHNLFYVVIAPGNQTTLSHVNSFFKDLSNTYELMKLGRHMPIGNGIFSTSSSSNENLEDDWLYSKISQAERDLLKEEVIEKLKKYASKLSSNLAKSIVEFVDDHQPPYDPSMDRFPLPSNQQSSKVVISTQSSKPNPGQNTPTISNNNNISCTSTTTNNNNTTIRPGSNSLLGPSGPTFNNNLTPAEVAAMGTCSDLLNQSLNPTGDQSGQTKPQTLIGSSNHGSVEDNYFQEDEAGKQSGIVIYLVDQFNLPSVSQNLRTVSTVGLLRCYSQFLESLPENIRRITQLQLISLDSIINYSRPIQNISRVDQLKALSMNLYSKCHRVLTNQSIAKSVTGFGPAAALENFLKTKNLDQCVSRTFTPPYILAPMKDKQTELGEMFGDRREKSSVLFCSYCVTEDQRWLLASVTNEKGELSETTVININVLDRLKKPKATVRRIALRRLMDFILSVMSEWTNPWRLIIGKLGRVGHGELKEWANIMNKRSLIGYSRRLAERCRQCTMLPSTETVSILSACLVSLEPDSRLRIMPDQFTSDDRQASFNKCSLSTPEDATATHILVFPTSASMQPAHGNVEDPLVGSGLDDDLLNQFPLEDGIDDLGVDDNMDDLFSTWDDNQGVGNDTGVSPHQDNLGLSSSNLQLCSGQPGDNTGGLGEETGQLLQQPLALGYYISTARIGHTPNWFWSTNPHLRNSCPVFLKSSLHIHTPCVQMADDLLHSGVGGQSRKSHQLDSNLTTDILRYVLEGYNSLSWLALNPRTYDRQSCLPVHMQNLLQLYHLMEAFS